MLKKLFRDMVLIMKLNLPDYLSYFNFKIIYAIIVKF